MADSGAETAVTVLSGVVSDEIRFGSLQDSIKHNDASPLQNDCRAIRHPRALTACQMFVPNPQLVGCTVLQYLQRAQLKLCPGGLGPPGGLFLALDQAGIEHSSLQSSGSLGSAQSGCIDGLSSLWPQSFGLTSSSTSGGTPVAPSPCKTASEKQKREAGLTSSRVLSNQSPDLAGMTPSAQQDEKSHPFSVWGEDFPARSDSKSQPSLSSKRRCPLDSLLEFQGTGSPGKISSRPSRGPEKSWNTLPCPKQNGSLGPLIASPSQFGADRGSQSAPWFGDELPSSESLSDFIAKLESHEATESPLEAKTWERCPSKGPNQFHGHPNQPSPTSAIFHGSFLIGQLEEKLQEPAEKAEVWEEDGLPDRLDLSSLHGSDSQQEAFSSSLSLRRKEGRRCLSMERSVPFSCSSPAAVHPRSKGHCRSSKEGGEQDVGGSKDLQASLKSICDGLESPCLQVKKTTLLNYEHDSSLSNQRHVGRSSRQSRRMTDLADIQDEGFASASHAKPGERHERCREPLPEEQGNGDRRGSTSSSLQGYSDCLQRSYDASTDLFDSSARAAGGATGTLAAVRAFSEQEGSPTKKRPTFVLSPSELDASWTTSPPGLSLQPASDQKTSTPVASSGAESEGSLSGTSDFVPYSQATPLAKPCQRARLRRGRESILGGLPLNRLSWIHGRHAKPRAALPDSLRRQCLSKFLPSSRGSDACRTAGDEGDPMPLCIDGSPAQKLFESDSEEWIPPSERKEGRRVASQHQKALGLRRRIPVGNVAGNQIVAKSPLSENGLGCETRFPPKKPPPIEAALRTRPIREDATNLRHPTVASPVLFRALVDRLSRAPASRSVPDAASWSPELFAGDPAQNRPFRIHPPE